MVEDNIDPGPVPMLQSSLPSLLGSKADNFPSKVLTSKTSGRFLTKVFWPQMGKMTSSYFSSVESSIATTEIIQRPAKAKLVAKTTLPRESDLMFWQEATTLESWSFLFKITKDHSSVKRLGWTDFGASTLQIPVKIGFKDFSCVTHSWRFLRFYIILFIVVPHQAIVLDSDWSIFRHL